MGLSSCCAFCRASSPHGYQSTGLWACCRRYGLVSLISRLGIGPRFGESSEPGLDYPRSAPSDRRSLDASSRPTIAPRISLERTGPEPRVYFRSDIPSDADAAAVCTNGGEIMAAANLGLEDVVVGPSSICDVNGRTGQLIYRG